MIFLSPPVLMIIVSLTSFQLASSLSFLFCVYFINRRVLTSNRSQDGRNDDRGSKNNNQKPKNLFHGISPKTFNQCEKYVTHDVTTQVNRMRLTTFNSQILGAATK